MTTGRPRPRLLSLPPWPHVSAARCPCPCVSPSPLAAAACWTPHVSATVLLPHAALEPPRDRAPAAMVGWARGHARAWSCPPPCAAPTQPLTVVGCKLAHRSPLNPQPPITELADSRSAIRTSAKSPSTRLVTHRHLVAVHSTPSQERGGRRGGKEKKKASKPPRGRRSSEPKTVPVLHH